MPTAAQATFLGFVAIATLAFVLAGGILGRVTIGRAALQEASGDNWGRQVPQFVIPVPVMVVGATAWAWLDSVNRLLGWLAIIALLLSARLLSARQPKAAELRLRRSRLDALVARHPATVWGLRLLTAAYVAAIVVALLAIRPNR